MALDLDPDYAVGRHFKYHEAIRSTRARRLGIDNRPGPDELRAIEWLAQELLDPVRDEFGPLLVVSWLRVPELNAKTPGSSTTSAHVWGGAADFVPLQVGILLADVVSWIAQSELPFDQVIYEHGLSSRWIHLGAPRGLDPKDARKQVLMKFHDEGYRLFDRSDQRVR